MYIQSILDRVGGKSRLFLEKARPVAKTSFNQLSLIILGFLPILPRGGGLSKCCCTSVILERYCIMYVALKQI